MIIDARSLPEGETLVADICIVGAGTAGITLARELIRTDMNVLLLESGGLEADRDTQALYKGANVGIPYFDLDKARARLFGGSSNRWHIEIGENEMGVRLRPFDPIDFEAKEWVPYSGWPFDKAHLDPYYDQAQTICQIASPAFDVNNWHDPEKRPSLLLNDDVQTIIYKIGSRRPFTQKYMQEITQADNINSVMQANVLEIETDAGGQKVTSLKAATLEGNQFSVDARIFVLAAGGIETPRLLLLSRRTHTNGLGNYNDLVGRFFMEHLHFWSGVFVPATPMLFKKMALYSSIHRVNQVPIIGKLALTESVLRREKLLNLNIQLMPSYMSERFNYLPVSGRETSTKVYNIYRKVRGRIGKALGREIKVFRLANMTEQVPNPNSQVSLMTEKDALGQNRAKLDWQVTDLDIRSTIRTQKLLDKAVRQTNLGRIHIQMKANELPKNLHGGFHHMGTTRMHEDPKQGVVDKNGRLHGLANLYIAGPSVFPTGGYANPVLTLVALTVRLADHLKEQFVEGSSQ
ncbi:MAG: GMC family oxidoreductase [Chloroflexi bacterium]|nr:GMC family oxidoreductase [Chloroflexota bacterium]